MSNVKDIAGSLEDVEFTEGEYTQFSNLKGYVIYCDPPYSEYNDYYDEDHIKISFDTQLFWDWCIKMSDKNIVFISGYSAPKNTDVVTSIKSNISYGNGGTKKRIEKLFVL
jgi:site-specific DNA-adenine methylase